MAVIGGMTNEFVRKTARDVRSANLLRKLLSSYMQSCRDFCVTEGHSDASYMQKRSEYGLCLSMLAMLDSVSSDNTCAVVGTSDVQASAVQASDARVQVRDTQGVLRND